MKKCWSKDPELRPYYDKIIDALNGEELMMNDTSKTHQEPEQHEYQNFAPLSDQGKGLSFLGGQFRRKLQQTFVRFRKRGSSSALIIYDLL